MTGVDMDVHIGAGGRVVSSHNDWDPLEEAVVGRIGGAAYTTYEPAVRAYFPDPRTRRPDAVPRTARDIEAAEAQLDGLARALAAEGVVVRRPTPVDHVRPIVTPRYRVPSQYSAACPRDTLLVIGDEIIEVPMAVRARSFEYLAYREVVTDYFRRGARWVSAPRPALSARTYAPEPPPGESFDAELRPALTEVEPCFDAASLTRVGRDVFYQPDLVSNDMGARWLARHLGPSYRLHRALFAHSGPPMHMDTTLMPLRAGLVMANPDRPPLDDTLRLFEKNGWDVVPGVSSMTADESPSPGVSNWISMNVLVLDERTVVCEERETAMIRNLERWGFRVIALPFTALYSFGGGFHCCVLDVRRRGPLRSYFPTLDG